MATDNTDRFDSSQQCTGDVDTCPCDSCSIERQRLEAHRQDAPLLGALMAEWEEWPDDVDASEAVPADVWLETVDGTEREGVDVEATPLDE